MAGYLTLDILMAFDSSKAMAGYLTLYTTMVFDSAKTMTGSLTLDIMMALRVQRLCLDI